MSIWNYADYAMDQETNDTMHGLGFSVYETGGGCTAWGKRLSNGCDIMVTDGEIHHCATMDTRATIGVTDTEGVEMLVMEFPTLRAALAAVIVWESN